MPTPTGLPKVGEVWELTRRIPGSPVTPLRFIVLERGRGDYWAMRVAIREGDHYRKTLWVDNAFSMKMGWLAYIGPAGPKTRRALSIG